MSESVECVVEFSLMGPAREDLGDKVVSFRQPVTGLPMYPGRGDVIILEGLEDYDLVVRTRIFTFMEGFIHVQIALDSTRRPRTPSTRKAMRVVK